jgi:hypothetical protein
MSSRDVRIVCPWPNTSAPHSEFFQLPYIPWFEKTAAEQNWTHTNSQGSFIRQTDSVLFPVFVKTYFNYSYN